MSYTITEKNLEEFKRKMNNVGRVSFFMGAIAGFIVGKFF